MRSLCRKLNDLQAAEKTSPCPPRRRQRRSTLQAFSSASTADAFESSKALSGASKTTSAKPLFPSPHKLIFAGFSVAAEEERREYNVVAGVDVL